MEALAGMRQQGPDPAVGGWSKRTLFYIVLLLNFVSLLIPITVITDVMSLSFGRMFNQSSGYYERSPAPKILTSTPHILDSESAQVVATHGSTLNANRLKKTWTFLLSNDHSSGKVHLIPRTESFHHCSFNTCNNSDIYNASGKVQLIPRNENFDRFKNVGSETIVERKRFWGF